MDLDECTVTGGDERFVYVTFTRKDGDWMTKLPPAAIPILRPFDKSIWVFHSGFVFGFFTACIFICIVLALEYKWS